MHPILLSALVGAVALAIGMVLGGALNNRWLGDPQDLSAPLASLLTAQLALRTLRRLRQGQYQEAITGLEHRLDHELTELVRHLQQQPRALENEQFRASLGSIAEYRAEYPSPELNPDQPLEFEAEDGERVRLRPSVEEALVFAREHGITAIGQRCSRARKP